MTFLTVFFIFINVWKPKKKKTAKKRKIQISILIVFYNVVKAYNFYQTLELKFSIHSKYVYLNHKTYYSLIEDNMFDMDVTKKRGLDSFTL